MLKLWAIIFYVGDYFTIPYISTKFHDNWSLKFWQLEWLFYVCGYINRSKYPNTRYDLFPSHIAIFAMYINTILPDFVEKIKFCVKVMQEESLIMCGCGNLNFSQLFIWKEMAVSGHLKDNKKQLKALKKITNGEATWNQLGNKVYTYKASWKKWKYRKDGVLCLDFVYLHEQSWFTLITMHVMVQEIFNWGVMLFMEIYLLYFFKRVSKRCVPKTVNSIWRSHLKQKILTELKNL